MDPAPTHASPDGGAAPVPEGPTVDLDAVRDDLAAVEATLERLDAETYGTCVTCGVALDDGMLAADPTATTCPAHRRP